MTVNHTGQPAASAPMSATVDTRPVDALFPGRREALAARRCRRCGEAVDPEGFTDDLSRAEWFISALDENCQTVVFLAMEGDE